MIALDTSPGCRGVLRIEPSPAIRWSQERIRLHQSVSLGGLQMGPSREMRHQLGVFCTCGCGWGAMQEKHYARSGFGVWPRYGCPRVQIAPVFEPVQEALPGFEVGSAGA